MNKQSPQSIDPVLLILVIILVSVGFLIFASASLGLMARSGASFTSVATSQLLFGVLGGSLALFITSSIHYRHWRRYAFYIFLSTLLLTMAVFIPGLGQTHAGATRWIDLGFTTIQPAELLKIGYVVYLATWFSGVQGKIEKIRYGLLPYMAISGIVGLVMLLQPDTDTFMIMVIVGMAMFVAAGAKWRDIAILVITGITLLFLVATFRPYVMDRLTTFMNPDVDPLGSSYQIHQSLIAIGSGGVFGRGYGQSIQKFQYLPEPIGDSIFAVYAEEFGFVGSLVLILIFLSLVLRGYRIAVLSPDNFGMLLVVGMMSLLFAQMFLNISSMIGIAPLSGLPLPFVSHGGTALMATLATMGIVLNVSKYRLSRRQA